MGFTQFPGGSVIYPSQTSYLALAMSANVTLAWPIEQQIGGDIVADIIDVTAATAGLSIQLGDARQVTTGYTALFNNVGAETVTILDNAGGTIATVAPATAWQVYLRSNSTAAGLWRTFQYAASVSTAIAAQLVGAGLKAISTTLNFALPVTSTAVTPTTLVSADRAKFYNWTGGAGVLNLPAAATAGDDWNIILRNSGSGNWTITPPSGTIDGGATKILAPGASCLVVTDGANFYTLSSDSGSGGGFNFIAVDISGTGDYTLSGVELNQVGYSFTGTLTGNRNVIVPNTTQEYWVANNTTGAFQVFFKTAAQSPGVEVLQGDRKILYSDGSNVYAADSSSVSFPIPVAQGGTGATSAGGARTNLDVPPNSRTISAGTGLTGGGSLASDRTISLSFLGLQNLSDPNADRILFWDDSAGSMQWLEVGSGLSISGTTISSTLAPLVSVGAALDISALAVGQSAIIYKSANTSKTLDSVPAFDPVLQFTNAPAGRYITEGGLSISVGGTGAGFVLAFPRAIFNSGTIEIYSGPDGLGSYFQSFFRFISSPQGGANPSGSVTLTVASCSISGMEECTAGQTLGLQWAQNSSSANATTLTAGSWLRITRIS